MVDAARIELATAAMSTQCSTTELHVHAGALSQGTGLAQASVEKLCQLRAQLEQTIDFGDQIAKLERLCTQFRVGRRAFGTVQRDGGKAGADTAPQTRGQS